MEEKQVEKLKDILHCVFLIDAIVNRFHNKVQFLNLNALIGRVQTWEEPHLEEVHENLELVLTQLEKVTEGVDGLEKIAVDLIASYTPPSER